MLGTYRAILHGNRLKWRDEGPEELPPDRNIEVLVTILGNSDASETARTRDAAMAAALGRLAEAGGLRTFGDPAAWERDTRAERPLPGREP